MGRQKKALEEFNEPNDDIMALVNDDKKIETIVEQEETKPAIPLISSFEWTPYVLSKLNPDELWNGCPTYEGLRRICYELLGTIVDIDMDVKQAPNLSNGNHTCILARLTIDHPISFYWLGDVSGRTIRYSHVADTFHGNGNDDPFAWRFASSTCWTRVKAALLRDTFRLKYVYSKEEMSDLENDDSNTNFINSNQVDGLDMICSRININTVKLLKGIWKKTKPNVITDDLNNIPFTVAVNAFSLLQSMQQNPSSIKSELIGFDQNWKKDIKCAD